MEINEEERKLVKGFAFLSEKPMIYVENIGEDQLDRLRHPEAHGTLRSNTEQTIICGKLEAEMAELPAGRAEDIPIGLRPHGIRCRAADPYYISSAWTHFIFHSGRGGVPRMDDHARHECTKCGRRDPYGSCRPLYSRGSLPL